MASSGGTRVLSTGAKELRYRQFRVRVVAGPDADASQLSDSAEFAVGSATGNHLVLSDRSVSRHHFTITATARGYLLRDLGSKNGTRLGGFRVELAYLEPGATIDLGETSLRFEPLEGEVSEPLSEEDRFGRLLGSSAAMRRIFAVLPKIAASDSTVLLEAETGTGKGVIADVIHRAGPRARGPFVVVDCSAIPPTLIESELFGHEKGAFTGAHASRAGAFEAARGGTIFLDEIGELPLEMQPKLLRALEERVVKRIGSHEPVKLDVRVIAATNRDLRKEVNKGSFRSDLYYRLNIVRLPVPPLRERREDIPQLVAHFWGQFAAGQGPPPSELVAQLAQQDWPGNVRELKAAVERAALLGLELVQVPGGAAAAAPAAEAAPVAVAPAPAVRFDPMLSFRDAKDQAMAAWEREYLADLLARFDGNLSRAAREARMDRSHLRELLKRHGMHQGE